MLLETPTTKRPTGQAWLKKLVWTVTLAASLAAVFGLFSPDAQAAPRLKAKVYMTKDKIPRGLADKELITFARKNQTTRIEETGEAEIKERRWKAYVLVAFNAPPGRLEYEMVFYDIQQGKRILVEKQSTLLSDPNQKNYVQRIILKRPMYKPNRKMEMVIVVSGQEVGRLKFKLVGTEAAGATKK